MPRRPTRRAGHTHARANLYDDITAGIIAELEAGRFPWVQPWGSAGIATPLAMPRNAATGRSYSGINILILWGAAVARGFSGQSWLTFRQAQALGGTVRRGERGTGIVFASQFVPEAERRRASDTGAVARGALFLKRFTVFSTDQCEGLPADVAPPAIPIADGLILPEVEALIRASGADLRLGGNEAFYAPGCDYVQVPRPEAFAEPINWHRTALHELGHWTGHRSRLDRDQTGRFGSPSYAREELIAELCAAFCCATLGIAPTVRHADYLGGWLDVLREDNRAIVRAASAASKAADFILAFATASDGSRDAPPAGPPAAMPREAEGCAVVA